MRLCHNKKALAFKTIISILLAIASFAAIMFFIKGFVGEAEASTAETVCRASVVMREKATVDIPIAGETPITPLLCRTIDKEIPKKKDASKEDVMREFANSMARCWWQFGDGLIYDVFKEGAPTTKNCFICYIATTRKTSDFKEEIDSKEFLKYLMNTPYKIEVEGDKCKNLGGVCEANKGDCIAKGEKWKYDENNLVCKTKYNQENNKKPVCCHSSYSCLNNGGECKEKGEDDGFVEYDKWDCPSDKICYIKDKNYVTYARYIQSYSSKGNMIITTPIKPGQAYAVSFGSPTTKSCDFCLKWGIGTGVGFAILTAATISTGGLATPLMVGVAAGVIEYVASKEIANIFNRHVNTIYLTTLDQALAEERCNLIESVGGVEGKGGGFGGGGVSGAT